MLLEQQGEQTYWYGCVCERHRCLGRVGRLRQYSGEPNMLSEGCAVADRRRS